MHDLLERYHLSKDGRNRYCLRQLLNTSPIARRLKSQMQHGHRKFGIRRARKECETYKRLQLHGKIISPMQMLQMTTITSFGDIGCSGRLPIVGDSSSGGPRIFGSNATFTSGQTPLSITCAAEASSSQFHTPEAWCKYIVLSLKVKYSADSTWRDDQMYTVSSSLGSYAIVAMLSIANHKLYNLGYNFIESFNDNESKDMDAFPIFCWCLAYFLCVFELFSNRERHGDRLQKQFILVGCVAALLHGRVEETSALENLVQVYPVWITGVLILSWISHLILHQWRGCSSTSGHGKNSINEEDEKSGFQWVRCRS